MAMSKYEFRARVTSDPDFREQLKDDPIKVLRSIGWDVDDDVSYEIVDMQPTKQYIVLPPLMSDELSESELAGVQGGTVNMRVQGPVCTI